MKYFAIVLLLVLICSACDNSSSGEVTCSGVEISFATEVMPIIIASCATNSDCHGSGSTQGPGPLTTFAQVSAAKTDISSSVQNGSMPKNSSLTAAQRNTIVCWVRNGGLNN